MLRPIFDQKTRRDGVASPDLLRALRRWREVLCRDLAELRTWGNVGGAPVHVFCDASGADARLGVVVHADGIWHWTSTTVGERGLKHFRRRRDKQIMGLELLAISLAFETFAPIIRRRRVIVYCDNTGAEVSFMGL